MKRTHCRPSGLCAASAVATLILSTGAPAARADTPPPTPKTAVLTLDYVNAEVIDVIRALAAQSHVNIALNPSVKGRVTVHLRDKSVDEALAVVTNLAGLGVRKVNDTYIVAPKAEMRQTLERIGSTRRIGVKHIGAQAAADLAQGAFADLTARGQGSAVILSGTPEDIDSAERLIKANDAQPAAITRVTERIEIRNRPAQQIATALPKMVPTVAVELAGSAVIISGSMDAVEAARANIELMDAPIQSTTETRLYRVKYSPAIALVVLLSGAVPDVLVLPGPESFTPPRPVFSPLSGQFVSGGGGSSPASSSMAAAPAAASAPGSDTTQQSATTNTNGVPLTQFKNSLSILLKGTPAGLNEALRILRLADTPPLQMMIEARVVDSSPEFTKNLGVEWEWNRFQFFERGGATGTAGPLGFGSYARSAFNPIATLNAMITNRQAKLLASPQTVVQNDQDASVFIGDTLRFQTLAQSSPTTGNQFTVVEVPVGIILLVHPRASDDGYITLRVHPVVSTITGFSAGLPQTSAREAETIVRVKDGDTLVIAGLIRDEDIKQMSKVPLLGDLPFIGHIFRNESRTHRRSEVMIFLTIKLIPQPAS